MAINGFKTQEDFAIYNEIVVNQEDSQGNWVRVENTEVELQPKKIVTVKGTDSTHCSTFTPLAENDKIVLIDSGNNIVVTTLGTVDVDSSNTVSTLDIFDDNSGIALYEFEDAASGGAVTCTGDSSYNGQWKNDSGNNIDGIYDIGKFGNAASFDGSDTHIIQFPAPFKDNDTFTVSAWFKWNGTAGQYVIMEAGVLQIPGDVDSKGNIRIDYPNNGGNYGSVNVGNGNWHHIVVIHNVDSKDNCYIDGTLDSQRDTASVDSYNNWWIGQYKNGSTDYEFDGLIDQVRIFNKALTDSEVNTLYNEQAAKYTADISSAKLSNPPKAAFKPFKTPVPMIQLESSENRMLKDATERPIVIFNPTDSSFNSEYLYNGETIVLDGKQLEVTSDIVSNVVSTVDDVDPLEDGSQVAGYQFEDSASGGAVACMNDSSYNGQWKTLDSNGNLVDTDGVYAAGKFENAASFDGSKWINKVHSVPNNGDSFSISLFINISKYADPGKLRYVYWSGKTDCMIGIDENGYLKFTNYNGTEHKVQTPNALKLNTWYYITTLKTSDGLKLYINKELVSTNTFTGAFNSQSDEPSIGTRANSDTESFNGLIDQVRIFNKALTSEEISLLYKEQKAKYSISSLGLSAVPQVALTTGHKELKIESSANNSVTVSSYVDLPLESNDNIVTDQGKVLVNDVTITDAGTIDTLDILGDNSGIALYEFEDDASGGVITCTGDSSYNGQWKNDSGNNIDGVYDTGKFGNAAGKFSDNNTYIDLSNYKFDTTNGITVSCWIKIDSNLNNNNRLHGIICKNTNSAENSAFSLYFDPRSVDSKSNCIYVNQYKDSSGNGVKFNLQSTANQNDGTWIHICFTWDGSTDSNACKLYINNALNATCTSSEAGNESSVATHIGANGASAYFEGLLDQVRIFNKALTDSEVNAVYNEGAKKYKLGFDSLGNAPTFAAIPAKTKSMDLLNTTFDSSNNCFKVDFNPVTGNGRAIQRRLVMPEKDITVTSYKSDLDIKN